jgi:RNA polymerase-binding transcription factor DksA
VAPVKAAPAKKAVPDKKAAPAKKAVPAKKAAPVKKVVPAKKAAPAKKVAPAKPATKAPAKVAPAKAAPVKKAAPVAKAAPSKKAAPAVKLTVKAAPAKKAPVKAAPAKAVPAKASAKAPVKSAPAKAPAKAKPAPAVKAKATPAKAVPAVKAPAKAAPAKVVAPAKPAATASKKSSSSKTGVVKTGLKTISAAQAAAAAKKSDFFKTNTFGESVLRNDKGKVIAKRDMNTLKRKDNQEEIKRYEPETQRSILDMTETSTGPSYRYSDEELAEFKNIINGKLEKAKAELQYLQNVIMRKDQGGTDDTENKFQNIEDGSASMEREQLNQLASRQITFISHLEQAMVRIENKTYGICRVTGKLIDKNRLRAVPHATLSIEAKNAKNGN